MTAGGHKKFLFDTEFGPKDDAKAAAKAQAEAAAKAEAEAKAIAETAEDVPEEFEELPPLPTYGEEDLERARAEGFAAGRDEATRDLAGALEQRLANAFETLDARIAALLDAHDRDREEHNRDAVAVATVIVRKLFPALNMDKAMAEIEHMIGEAMQRTSGAPTLIVRVSPDLLAEVDAKVRELAALRGREGTVTVSADDSLQTGDVSVEWDGGGMIRDTQAMWRDIDAIIERNLGERVDTISQEAAQPDSAQDTASAQAESEPDDTGAAAAAED